MTEKAEQCFKAGFREIRLYHYDNFKSGFWDDKSGAGLGCRAIYIEGSGAGADYIEAGMKAGQNRLGLWGQSLPFPSGMEEGRRAEQQHDYH